MNLLPDMIILEFCEWLKVRIEHSNASLDFFDIVFDQECSGTLREYAKEYLQIKRDIDAYKGVLHRFIDSDDFLNWFIDEHPYGMHRCRIDYSRWYHYAIFHPKFEDVFCRFVEKDYLAHDNAGQNQWSGLDEYQLADSTSYVFSNINRQSREKKPFLQFMNRVELDLDIEIDFLEWLIQTRGEAIDIGKMPRKTFELLASNFQIECAKTEKEREKLIKSFMQKDFLVLSEKLAMILPKRTAKRAKDLGYICSRYQDKSVRYKCFIVPLQAEEEEYIQLMEKRWYDLHYLSGDYLDIYYSETDYGKSGYQIMNQMSRVPQHLKTKAPVIVLWEESLERAQGIDITRLDSAEIFEVVRCMVNSIRDGKVMDDIVKEANHMSKSLREEHRPIYHNELIVRDNAIINGPVAVVNKKGTMTSVMETKACEADVLHQLERMKSIISELSDLNNRQKQLLNEIIENNKAAIKENSQDKKEEGKKSFKNAIDLIGAGSKIVSAISGLTSILKYFGISPV